MTPQLLRYHAARYGCRVASLPGFPFIVNTHAGSFTHASVYQAVLFVLIYGGRWRPEGDVS